MELLRHVNVYLTGLVFAGLVWRLLGCWPIAYPLAKWVCGLLAALYLLIALGTARAAAGHFPVNEVQLLVTLHALFTLGVVIAWPRLLDHPPSRLPRKRRSRP